MIKEKIERLSRIFLFIAVLIIYGNQSFGQDVCVTAGFGIPELLNLGVRLQGNQFQMGVSVGTIPAEDESLFSISVDMFFHFGGLSELSDRRLWYIRTGVDYLEGETETIYDNYYYLNLRIGRDFNISKKFGIEIDIGPVIQISHKHESKTSSSSFDLSPPVFPGIGIALFYKF